MICETGGVDGLASNSEGLEAAQSQSVSPHSAAQEIDPEADHSIRAALSDGGYDESRMTPYVPDVHGELNDSALHLSC
jgi:hypothetical protein